MAAETFLISISHLGPIPQLLTQAWLQISLAAAIAATTRRAVSRYRWKTRIHLTRLAYRYKDPPMLSGHHSCTIDRSPHFHQTGRLLHKYTPRTKQSISLPPLVYLAGVPHSLLVRHYCHSQHISSPNLHSPLSPPTLKSETLSIHPSHLTETHNHVFSNANPT